MNNRNIWLVVFFIFLLWSGSYPKDRFTWYLEVAPALIGFVVLALSYNNFRLTRLLYILILLHSIVLMIGGHYTYAEVPFFDYLKELFGWTRNNYDKVGHFMQGFVPAIIVREIVLRRNVISGSIWQSFFIICFCLAFSAFYELVEWWVAIAIGQGANAFLGTQGYIWDTQSDMGFALLGSVTALVTLGRYHSRQLANIST